MQLCSHSGVSLIFCAAQSWRVQGESKAVDRLKTIIKAVCCVELVQTPLAVMPVATLVDVMVLSSSYRCAATQACFVPRLCTTACWCSINNTCCTTSISCFLTAAWSAVLQFSTQTQGTSVVLSARLGGQLLQQEVL